METLLFHPKELSKVVGFRNKMTSWPLEKQAHKKKKLKTDPMMKFLNYDVDSYDNHYMLVEDSKLTRKMLEKKRKNLCHDDQPSKFSNFKKMKGFFSLPKEPNYLL